MNNELISVIVPCYNVAAYIRETAKSVLNQTHRFIQLILVDDGSTDKTGKIVDEIGLIDSRVVVIHKTNGGVSSARLAGIEVAIGEWIGFVDGDDIIEPGMYARLLSNAHRFDADISHCGYQHIYPSKVVYHYNTGKLVKQDNITGINDLLEGSFVEPSLCNKLYKRSLFSDLFDGKHMDTSIRNNEDLLMNYFLFKQSKRSIFEDTCPYHYIVRLNSASKSAINEHILCDPLKVIKVICSDLKDKRLICTATRRITGQLISLATYSLNENRELVLSVRSRARKELRQILPTIVKGDYPVKTKCFCAWCAIWPWSYQAVHTVYSYLKGVAYAYKAK